MIGIVRSELVRLRRRGLVLGWFGVTAGLAALINFVMFQVVRQQGTGPQSGPGVSFPTADELLGKTGIVAGLSAASSMFGVACLAFWAIAAASDYTTGLVRLIVAAEPRRWRLLLGKWLALALFTAAVTLIALVADLVVAPPAAQAAGYTPQQWGTDLPQVIGHATLNLYCALLVWGTIGLGLATLTRSAGIAIGVGLGYVLLLESVIKAAAPDQVGDWLPGTTINALAAGGTSALSYAGALGLGTAYVLVALGLAATVFSRREITD